MGSWILRTHLIVIRKKDEWNVYKAERDFDLSSQLIGSLS